MSDIKTDKEWKEIISLFKLQGRGLTPPSLDGIRF
jgi:hypothetical protein